MHTRMHAQMKSLLKQMPQNFKHFTTALKFRAAAFSAHTHMCVSMCVCAFVRRNDWIAIYLNFNNMLICTSCDAFTGGGEHCFAQNFVAICCEREMGGSVSGKNTVWRQ